MNGNIFHFEWEVSLLLKIQELIETSPFLLQFFSFVTFSAEAYALIFVILFLYWGKDKNMGRKIAISVLASQLCNSMLKNVFFRIRPYAAVKEIKCFKAPESGYDLYDMNKQGYSFPSGHAAGSSSLSCSIYLKKKKPLTAFILVLYTLLVCISRMALGVHYPTDVIVGVLQGVTISLLICHIESRIRTAYLYLMLLLISSIGIFYCQSDDYFTTLGLLLGACSGDLIERKYIRFASAESLFATLARVAVGSLLFLLLNYLLKLPFSQEILKANDLLAHCLRTFRYGICAFALFGIYPILFRYPFFYRNIFSRKENKDAN